MSVPGDIRLLVGEKELPLPSTRPRPLDLPSPVVAGMGISARSGDIDVHNVKGTKLLLPGIIRRRLLSPFTLIVMGAAFFLLGWWNYWYGLSDRIPVQTERVVSTLYFHIWILFSPSQTHVLPLTLSKYVSFHFISPLDGIAPISPKCSRRIHNDTLPSDISQHYPLLSRTIDSPALGAG